MENDEMNFWTEGDYQKGWCLRSQIGEPVSGSGLPENSPMPENSPAPEIDPAVIALDSEGAEGYAREAADYHADRRAYVARTPPGVVKALLDWIEARAKERDENATSLLEKGFDEIIESDSDWTIYKAILAAIMPGAGDDTKATMVREAIGVEDWRLRDMLASMADTLPVEMRNDLGKHLLLTPK